MWSMASSRATNVWILVFAKVVYRVDSVFLEVGERLEELGNVHRCQAFEGCMRGMCKFNRVN